MIREAHSGLPRLVRPEHGLVPAIGGARSMRPSSSCAGPPKPSSKLLPLPPMTFLETLRLS